MFDNIVQDEVSPELSLNKIHISPSMQLLRGYIEHELNINEN
jgi:hypothetical protein